MKIVLGITGSVATTVVPKLIGELLNYGHEVKVVATTPALFFIPPGITYHQLSPLGSFLAIEANGAQPVELFRDKDEWPEGGWHKKDPVRHIEFRDWGEALLIAPLTANTLAKIYHGICDNFLTCIARAWVKDRPLVLAPAMNTEMWDDLITAEQLTGLGKRFKSLHIAEPVEKRLACGDFGKGAMANIDTIVQLVNNL